MLTVNGKLLTYQHSESPVGDFEARRRFPGCCKSQSASGPDEEKTFKSFYFCKAFSSCHEEENP